MDPNVTPKKAAETSETLKASVTTVDLHGARLPVSPGIHFIRAALMGAAMFTSASSAQKSVEPHVSGESTSVQVAQSDILHKFQTDKPLNAEDIKEILSTPDAYVKALISALKQHGLDSYVGYSICTNVASHICEARFQQAVISLLPKQMDDNLHSHAYSQLCSASKVDPAVVTFGIDQLQTENAHAVIDGLISLNDPAQLRQAFPAIKKYAEKTAHSEALKLVLGSLPPSQREDYFLGIAKKFEDTSSGVSGCIEDVNFKDSRIIDYLARRVRVEPVGSEQYYLAKANTEYSSRVLINLLTSPKSRLAAIESLMSQNNATANGFLADPKIDFGAWKDYEIANVKLNANYKRLNSKGLEAGETLKEQKLVKSFLTTMPDDQRIETYDKLHARCMAANDPKQTFNDYILSKLDPQRDQRIFKAFTRAEELGINHPARFNVDDLESIISFRNNPDFTNTKHVVIIAPSIEADGTFYNLREHRQLLAQGYQVLFYEAGNDHEDLEKIITDCRGKNVKADALFLIGHGSSDAIALSNNKTENSKIRPDEEQQFIDSGDAAELKKLGLDTLVAKGQPIISGGCFNAAGENNLRDALGEVFSNNPVLGADREYYYSKLEFKDGKISAIRFVYPDTN